MKQAVYMFFALIILGLVFRFSKKTGIYLTALTLLLLLINRSKNIKTIYNDILGGV